MLLLFQNLNQLRFEGKPPIRSGPHGSRRKAYGFATAELEEWAHPSGRGGAGDIVFAIGGLLIALFVVKLWRGTPRRAAIGEGYAHRPGPTPAE